MNPDENRDFSRIKTHTIRGCRYKIKWRRPRLRSDEIPGQNYGSCDHPRSANKTIYIYPKSDALELLDTVIDECLHGSLFDIEETAIHEATRDIKELLVRMGIEVKFNPK